MDIRTYFRTSGNLIEVEVKILFSSFLPENIIWVGDFMRNRHRICILFLMLSSVILLGSCERKEVIAIDNQIGSLISDMERPGYQKDKTLAIALDTPFGSSYNPFTRKTLSEAIILDVIFSSPLSPNSANELIPWNGNIISGGNADGSVSYLVSIDEGMHFTDGKPITIDDYIYPLYVKADPSYMGEDSLIDVDIRGIESYYYDDENWEENLQKLDEFVKANYSIANISQDDFTSYLVETHLEGHYEEKSESEWRKLLAMDGWKDDVDRAETTEDLLELVALYEYAENLESYDPEAWYRENLLEAYIENNLNGESHVETISGIEKINEHLARITIDNITPDTVRKLNSYIVPHHHYGAFEKGNIQPVLDVDIPLGSGPYSFYAEYENKVVLTANESYKEGIPNIGSIVFEKVDNEAIIRGLDDGSIDIGLLPGKGEYLEALQANGMKCELVPRGSYPSVFLNTRTMTKAEREKLYGVISNTVRNLPLSPLERKLSLPISPMIAEYPENLKARKAEEPREPIADGKDIRILIDDRIHSGNMELLLRNLHTELRKTGNKLETIYEPLELIIREMESGSADAAMLPSVGSLEEKARMYHSEGSSNIQGIHDRIIDEILEHIEKEASLDERRKSTGMLTERIMEESLEVPLFQNRAIIAYNQDNLDMESVPNTSSASWNFLSSLWRLRKN